MRKYLTVTFMSLLLAGCATTHVKPHEGRVITPSFPQSQAQCAAQPQLDWCRK